MPNNNNSNEPNDVSHALERANMFFDAIIKRLEELKVKRFQYGCITLNPHDKFPFEIHIQINLPHAPPNDRPWIESCVQRLARSTETDDMKLSVKVAFDF